MKCHAGVQFPDGKPCPKCGAELGEVCWPGINADLLELPKLRNALKEIHSIVHVPTKDTMFRGAYQHFQSDFDRIRAICKDALPSGIREP